MKGGVSHSHSLHSKKTRDVTILVTRLFLIDKSVTRPEVSGQDAHTRKQRGGGHTKRKERGGVTLTQSGTRGGEVGRHSTLFDQKHRISSARSAPF